jgi:hypothetical protein
MAPKKFEFLKKSLGYKENHHKCTSQQPSKAKIIPEESDTVVLTQ